MCDQRGRARTDGRRQDQNDTDVRFPWLAWVAGLDHELSFPIAESWFAHAGTVGGGRQRSVRGSVAGDRRGSCPFRPLHASRTVRFLGFRRQMGPARREGPVGYRTRMSFEGKTKKLTCCFALVASGCVHGIGPARRELGGFLRRRKHHDAWPAWPGWPPVAAVGIVDRGTARVVYGSKTCLLYECVEQNRTRRGCERGPARKGPHLAIVRVNLIIEAVCVPGERVETALKAGSLLRWPERGDPSGLWNSRGERSLRPSMRAWSGGVRRGGREGSRGMTASGL